MSNESQTAASGSLPFLANHNHVPPSSFKPPVILPSSTPSSAWCLFFVLFLLSTLPAMTDEAKHRLDRHHYQRHRHRHSARLRNNYQPITAMAVLERNKIRPVRGKYTMKEEVVRRIEIDHPCKLTSTAVKVTFPGMKSEVLVSFLGYKEPNLMFVNRCKGLCSSDAIGKVACVPTKRTWRKVHMQLKTQVLGRDAQEKAKDLVLEEHTECSCSCLTMSPSQCIRPELFNNETCSCACDNSIYRRDMLQCEAYSDRKWDEVTCSCRHADETIPPAGGSLNILGPARGDDLPRGHQVDPPSSGCTECFHCLGLAKGYGRSSIEAMSQSASGDIISQNSWTIVASCTFLVGLLGATTFYYWRKTRLILEEVNLKAHAAMLQDFDSKSMDGGDLRFEDPSFEYMLAAAVTSGTKSDHVLKGSEPSSASPQRKAATRLERANSLNELDVQHFVVNGDHTGDHHQGNGDLPTTLSPSAKSNSLGRSNHLKRTNRSSRSRSKFNGHANSQRRDKHAVARRTAETDLIQQCFENVAEEADSSLGGPHRQKQPSGKNEEHQQHHHHRHHHQFPNSHHHVC